MTKYGLSAKLTADTGVKHSEDDAQELIDTFEELFPDFTKWRKDMIDEYEQGNAIRTLDGWVVWPDNDNPRSVGNAPIQGAGASIMRKAVDIAVTRYGIKVIFTLHDAIYIEGKRGEEGDMLKLYTAMQEGFAYYFQGTKYEHIAKKIKLDPKAWGEYFPDPKEEIKDGKKVKVHHEITVGKFLKVPVSKIHIDSRALNDYNRFSKYFSEPETDLL